MMWHGHRPKSLAIGCSLFLLCGFAFCGAQSYRKQRTLAALERDLSIQTLALAEDRKIYALPVHIASDGACQTGDADALRLAAAVGEGTKVLLTVEDLGVPGGHGVLDRQEMDPSQLTKDPTVVFNLPPARVPRELGIFICTDRAGEHRCGNKPVSTYQHMLGQLFDEVRGQRKPVDRLFFFAWLVVDRRTAAVVASAPWSDGAVGGLQQYIHARGAGFLPTRPGPTSGVTAVSARIIKTLGSLPPVAGADGLHISLPHMDRSKCTKG